MYCTVFLIVPNVDVQKKWDNCRNKAGKKLNNLLVSWKKYFILANMKQIFLLYKCRMCVIRHRAKDVVVV